MLGLFSISPALNTKSANEISARFAVWLELIASMLRTAVISKCAVYIAEQPKLENAEELGQARVRASVNEQRLKDQT
ncbi:hypothetical protein CO675_27440 [Bradyrhizobium sp. C9]|nr:hypothetical protein CO675_27440 [Bradyrhizobium sp. C9]